VFFAAFLGEWNSFSEAPSDEYVCSFVPSDSSLKGMAPLDYVKEHGYLPDNLLSAYAVKYDVAFKV